MTSQLNVDAIVDKAGSGGTNVKVGNTSTYVGENSGITQNLVQSLIKAWGFTDGSATLIDTLNVSSGTDNGTGDYTYTYTSNMNNQYYGGAPVAKDSGNYIATFYEIAASNTRIVNRSDSTAAHDNGNCWGVWGDLA